MTSGLATPGRSPLSGRHRRYLTPTKEACTLSFAARHSVERACTSSNGLSPGSTAWRVPSGASDSEDEATPGLTFQVTAPSGWTSDEDAEIESESTNGVVATRHSPLLLGSQVSLAALTPPLHQELVERLQLDTAAALGLFEAELGRVEAADRKASEHAKQRRAAEAAAREAREAAARQDDARRRAALLSTLRSGHTRAAEAAASHLAAAAAAEAAEAAERERKARAEAEARQKAEHERLEQERRRVEVEKTAAAAAQERAAKQKAVEEETAKLKAAANAAAAAVSTPAEEQNQTPSESAPSEPAIFEGSASALDWRKELMGILNTTKARMAQLEAAAGYRADPGSKDARRKLYKALNLEVQQVSASREQVGKKAARLAALLRALPSGSPAEADAWLQLAAKLGVQCEVQVARLPGFAFPLAEVAVGVAAAVPGFAPVLVAHLATLCPLCIPAIPKRAPGADEAAWLKAAGYKVTVDADSGEVKRESGDEHVARMDAFVRFYAALMQCDAADNPHGLKQGWTWLARFLNGVPADRHSAAALNAFLQVTAYRLHRAYRGQATKLFQVIERHFLPQLAETHDMDAKASYTRIQTFLGTKGYETEPEGRALPQYDASSYERA